jgi:hypothetical protein
MNRFPVPSGGLALCLPALCLLLAGVPILAARDLGIQSLINGPAGCRLVLDPPLPESTPGTIGLSFTLPGEGLLGVSGAPDLPLISRLVEIPARSGVRLQVLEERWESLGLQQVEPLQERLHTQAELPLPWLQDPVIHGTDAFYPGRSAWMSEPMLVRDTRLVAVQVAPLRWNPVSGELQRLVHLELECLYEGTSTVNTLDHAPRPSALFGPLLEHQVARLEGASTLDDVDFAGSVLPLNYLVFTRDNALDNTGFQDWLDWRFRRGHRVEVVTDEDINWNTTGIRNRIISEYNGDTPPDFVMLVGDADGGSYTLPTSNSQYDHFYATVSGSDILADVVVGRISARSSTHLSTIFNKILAYEKAPDLTNPDWLHRASFLTGEGHCGLSMRQLSRSIAFDLVEKFEYSQIDTAWCAQSPSYVYNWYSQGISFHNYRGWVGMEGLDRNQLLAMTQGNRTPISVIFTCNSGTFNDNFYEPAFTETFLRAGQPNNPGGGAAAMGFCTPNTHTAYNNIVCGGFWSALMDYDIRAVGTAMFWGKYELYRSLPDGDVNINNFSYWANLMGDPGMPVWLGEPGVLSMDGLPVTIPVGSSRLEVVVVDAQGEPVSGAAVCASQTDGFQVLGLTNAEGLVVLTLPALQATPDLMLTATADDFVPALADINVTSSNPVPVVTELVVNDSQSWLSPGQASTLDLSLDNTTAQTLTGITVELQVSDTLGMASTATASLPDLAPGASAPLLAPLALTLHGNRTDLAALPLDLRFVCDQLEVIHHRMVEVRSPRITVENPSVQDTEFSPGGSADLVIGVRNTGELDGNGLEFSGHFLSGLLFTLGSGPVTLDLAAGAASGEALVFTVQVGAGAWPGANDLLVVDWTDGSGRSGSLRVPVRVGAGISSEPTGPDGFGYLAWENTDPWGDAPVYEWVEIAPLGGGAGTVLTLTDNGDEQDDAALVDLPFPVRFYGREYTQMGVCSNGFVTFGPDAHLETDFRNHYLPIGMGPEPMMAVMWDDHYLDQGSQVCVWHDEANHRMVVEWYNMLTNSNQSRNTFQLLLPDPAFTPGPTGEGEFTYQYLLFENNQSNDQDFPFCTIGIKDHTALRGLTLTNYDIWNGTATEFTGGRAIRFTVPMSGAAAGGEFELLTQGLHFSLGDEVAESATDTLFFRNTGDGVLQWTARVELEEGALRSSGRATGGDGDGYTWIDSDEPECPPFNWVETVDDGTAVDFVGNDTAAGPFELPFDFPYYGNLHGQMFISPNGWLSFTDSGDWWYNAGGFPGESAPLNAIAPWWDDLLSNEDLAGHCHFRETPDSVVVAWTSIPHYNPGSFGGPFTFQVILESNGRITLQLGDMAEDDPDSDSGTIGLSGPDAQTGFVVRHMRQSRDNYVVRITPPGWLHAQTQGGAVAPGATGHLVLQAVNNPNGLMLPTGDYMARVILGAPGVDDVEVSVGLSLGTTAVSDGRTVRPSTLELGLPWPNPFNPTTRVELRVAESSTLSLSLFNLQGQLVRQLVDSQTVAPGSYTYTIDGSGLASGVYLLQLDSPAGSRVRKLMLIK